MFAERKFEAPGAQQRPPTIAQHPPAHIVCPRSVHGERKTNPATYGTYLIDGKCDNATFSTSADKRFSPHLRRNCSYASRTCRVISSCLRCASSGAGTSSLPDAPPE